MFTDLVLLRNDVHFNVVQKMANLAFSRQKCDFKVILMSCDKKTLFYIRVPVLLNSLQKRDKMLGKLRILSLFPNPFNKFNNNMSTHVRFLYYLLDV